MLKDILIELYERDLGHLRAEVEQYSDEADLWKTSGDITNSAGNLTLHLTGNLKHFIGAVLGGSGFVRDRDAEFSSEGVSRDELLADLSATAAVVKSTLEKLTDEDLANTYPIEVFGKPMTTGFFLAHLTTHLNYHVGQINYHRRLLAAKRP
ncbi:MAG: DinB family protein [Pyrinomonadaceae bacterium]